MINPNKYHRIEGVVTTIDHWLGDAEIITKQGVTFTVNIGRDNNHAVHIGDTVRAEVCYRIISERYYGSVYKNLNKGA